MAATAATIQTSTTANAGANDVALAIAALRGGAADQSYAAFVSSVGCDVQSTQSTEQIAVVSPLDAIDDQRQSVSGVSLDEEMTNLVAVPARLPGLGADDDDDRRDARHADQPDRHGGALISMQRITTQMIAQRSLDDLTQAFDRLSKTQEQLSSGKRITNPSDDPYGAGHAVQLNGGPRRALRL